MKIKLPGGVLLSDQDVILGLVVCFLALVIISVGAAIVVFTGQHWAMEIVLMGVSWWFGATMVWVGEKYYQKYRNR